MGWRRVATLGIGLAGIIASSRAPRTGPAEPIHTFGRADAPIASSGVAADEGGWRIRRADRGTVPLFEVTPPGDLFFFSSRRRHTRFDCDWSSDVCSSD